MTVAVLLGTLLVSFILGAGLVMMLEVCNER